MPSVPRTPGYTAKYHDALHTLAAPTGRPPTVINTGGSYAIRAEFAFNRYLIATNNDHGLGDDPDTTGSWRLRIHDRRLPGEPALADISDAWLIDALDQTLAAMRRDGMWITADPLPRRTRDADTHRLGPTLKAT